MSSPHELEFPYPEVAGQLFRCPVCSLSYKMFTSFTRHVAKKHPREVSFSFKCTQCDQPYRTKRSVSIHFAKAHLELSGHPSALTDSPASAEELACEYCEERLPYKRSLGQHIRNQHAAEASHDSDLEAASHISRLWTDAEHALFLDAMEKHGPSSNVVIARYINSKTAKQVSMHKRIFLRDHPRTT